MYISVLGVWKPAEILSLVFAILLLYDRERSKPDVPSKNVSDDLTEQATVLDNSFVTLSQT